MPLTVEDRLKATRPESTPRTASREATDGPVLGSEEIRNEMEEIFKRHRVAFDERYVWNRNANGSDALVRNTVELPTCSFCENHPRGGVADAFRARRLAS